MTGLRAAARRLAAGPAGRWIERLGRREPGVAILLYHRVVERPGPDPFSLSVTLSRFEEQMRWLAGRYRVMPVAEALLALESGTLPERRVVSITFDDGYRDNLTRALPVLRSLGLPATLFLATGYVGARRPFWWDRLCRGAGADVHDGVYRALQAKKPVARDREIAGRIAREPEIESDALPMDADEIGRLVPSFDVGGHGHDHVSLGRTDAETARGDLASCAAALPRVVEKPIRLLAFPFGAEEDATPEAARAAESAGFDGGLATVPGVARRGGDPWLRPRLWVHDVPADRLAAALLRGFLSR